MRLVWSSRAQADARNIFDYVTQHDEEAAERILIRLETTAERLIDYPFLYRSGRIPGTREALAHPNYLLIYRIATDAVEIMAIVHTRQQYP